MKKTRLAVAALLVMGTMVSSVFAAASVDETAMLMKLRQKYPNTKFQSVSQSQLPGVYEVVMGRNVAYVEEGGRYFLFGHLFDMQTQTDLTEGKIGPDAGNAKVSKVDFSALPIADAVVTVKGTGARKLAVFSDPDCPYCVQLEQSLSKVTDVTIYTFLFPLEQLHPQSKGKAIGVWCAADRAKAWAELMSKSVVPGGDCENPIERNMALAEKLGINGTPTIILSDGSMLPGAPSAEKLNQMLGTPKAMK